MGDSLSHLDDLLVACNVTDLTSAIKVIGIAVIQRQFQKSKSLFFTMTVAIRAIFIECRK